MIIYIKSKIKYLIALLVIVIISFLFILFSGFDSGSAKNFVVVDLNGHGDYKSISKAISLEKDGTMIKVMPGDYYENIHAWGRKVNIIGTNKGKCRVISVSGLYENPPAEISHGYVKNITFYHKYVKGKSTDKFDSSNRMGYAVHIDNSASYRNTLKFENCDFISDFMPAVGVGLRPFFSLEFINCKFTNNASVHYTSGGKRYLGAFYLHDSADKKYFGKEQKLKCNNCEFISKSMENVMTFNTCSLGIGRNQTTVEFVKCITKSIAKNSPGKIISSQHYNGWIGTSFKLSQLSNGNSNNVLNYKK